MRAASWILTVLAVILVAVGLRFLAGADNSDSRAIAYVVMWPGIIVSGLALIVWFVRWFS